MADFQQGIIAFIIIIIVSIWGVVAAGGPNTIVDKLKNYNSTVEWQIPASGSGKQAQLRIIDSQSKSILAEQDGFFNISDETPDKEPNDGFSASASQKIKSKVVDEEIKILWPEVGSSIPAGNGYTVVWTKGDDSIKRIDVQYSYDGGNTWHDIARNHFNGQSWRLNPFSFTGMFDGQFPIAWFLTMLVIALIGGFGMGTSIDWYPEAQRIQSAKTVRDASYSIWAGSAMVLIRNSIWAAAIIGFFVLFPGIGNSGEYEMAWYKIGFDYLPVGLVGFLFAGVLAIHLSTVSTHLNLGAMYATRDFYHHYVNPKASESKLVNVGRISTFLLLLGSFVFGAIIGEELTAWLIFALWIMAAGVWLPNILQVIWWRFNSWGYLSSWIANLGLSWLIVWILPYFGIIPALPDYMQFWLLIICNALIYIPVTFMTNPEDMDHLVAFYVMSRPIGFWGPVRREAEKRGMLA